MCVDFSRYIRSLIGMGKLKVGIKEKAIGDLEIQSVYWQ